MPSPTVPFVRLQASRGWGLGELSELWRYRDLLFILVQRDVKLRYKQTILGVTWVVLQPLLSALIFTVIFGRLAKLPSDGVPYLLFAFTSLLAWGYLSGALARAGNSLVGQSHLITKVYFPRLLIPLAATFGVLVDLAVGLATLVVLLALYGVVPGPELLLLPVFLLLITVLACGASLWLSALGVYYRDFVFAMPFLLQVWMYVTPVVFPASLVPERWRPLLAVNPMASFVEGVRWSVLGRAELTGWMVLISTAVTVLTALSGLVFFRRVERRFSDVI